MTTLRVFFSKTGRAKYISHLDLTRCLTRCFARTDIPAWFTEGYNPHFYLTFALPLSLGITSEEESFDFRIMDEGYTTDRVQEVLNRELPADIRVTRVAVPVDDPSAIVWAEYRLGLEPDGDTAPWAKGFETFMAQPEILAEKKTKHRVREVDLAPLSTLLAIETGVNEVTFTLRLAAGGTVNISPSLLLDTFTRQTGLGYSFLQIERTAILKEDLTAFC